MDEFDAPAEEQGGDPTITIFLGLYLLVLAFFILLVTISTLEEVKSQVVMDSLSSTFTTVLPPTTELTPFPDEEGEIMAGQKFQERITGIFATTLQVAKVDIVQPGRLMKISMPADSMFYEGDTKIRENRYPLLDRIVAAISARPVGLRYDMEFVIGAKKTEEGTLPIGQTLEMKRAGVFAREMLGRGVPPDSIAIGLKAGQPNQIDIWYYVRNVDEAELQFEGLQDFETKRKKDEAEIERRRKEKEEAEREKALDLELDRGSSSAIPLPVPAPAPAGQ